MISGSSLLDETCLRLYERLVDSRYWEAGTPEVSTLHLGLSGWYSDLLLRIKELEAWTSDFNLPNSVWLAGFFNPQSFLTAIMQSTARKNELPLDKMTLICEVTHMLTKEEVNAAPAEGANVGGLFLEVTNFRLTLNNKTFIQGARWDYMHNCLTDSRLKELHPSLPIMFIRAVTQDIAVS